MVYRVVGDGVVRAQTRRGASVGDGANAVSGEVSADGKVRSRWDVDMDKRIKGPCIIYKYTANSCAWVV